MTIIKTITKGETMHIEKLEGPYIKKGNLERQVIRAFYINPFTKNITEIILPAMQNQKEREERLLMMQGLVAGLIERIGWDYSIDPDEQSHWTQDNDLFANEEGLFQGWTHGFKVKNLWEHQPILGPAIVVGVDHKNGKAISATVTPLELKNSIVFGQWNIEL